MTTSSRLFSKVLLTNDDGFDAPGLRTLTEVAEDLAEEVWIVAPNHAQSGTSQSLSLHSPLRVSQKEERRYSISGTPGDCVAMAVRHLMVSGRPDLILSGINRGANLGIETVFSGTVGAAMTGLLLGIPSMALSQAFSDRNAVRWDTARALAPEVIRQFAKGAWSQSSILNINFPDVPVGEVGPIELTTQGVGLMEDVEVISIGPTSPTGTSGKLMFRIEPWLQAPLANCLMTSGASARAVSQRTALRSLKAWLRAIDGIPSNRPVIAAPTVPEKTVSIPRFAPRLMPDRIRSGLPDTIRCLTAMATHSPGVPETEYLRSSFCETRRGLCRLSDCDVPLWA